MQVHYTRSRTDVGSVLKTMDRWILIAAVFFFTSEVFSFVALGSPNWITSYGGSGPYSMGLVVTCKGSVGEDHMDCQRQNNLSPYWTTSLVLIILGMLGILIVFTILIMALWKNRTEVGSVAKWISFFSTFSFCFAALVFPIGFVDEEIGGNPYYLPEQQHIGYAYICFILSILFSVLGHVFINKICFSSFQSLNFNDAI